MTTTEVAHSTEYYNPDDVLLPHSPVLKPHRPNLVPSPSPPPTILMPMSRSPSPPTSGRKSAHRKKIRASQGDGVLIAHLAGGNRIDISRQAAMEPLASDDEMEDDTQKGVVVDINGGGQSVQHSAQLAALAAGALAHSTPEVVVEVVNDEKEKKAASEMSSPMDLDKPVEVKTTVIEVKPEPEAEPTKMELKRLSPMRSPGMAAGELAPIQEPSPKSDKVNGNVTLPSINAALGNLKHLAETATAAVEKDANGVHLPSFSQSPPGLPPHFTPANGQPSPPISPGETFQRRELPSPRPGAIITSQYYYQAHLPRPQQTTEGYSSASTVETPSTDSSGPTPATATIADRMSIDGITHPQVGGFQCEHPGCTAQPFQTQYLLNSHANVHSSSRPHYCTVKGCARSEGGKGFKRKNEMIRHGLVHDSPGYVCPFCPDREHKYPRPDNLQRHVRVHHVDKDKDDPKLRDVLSQRPEGPNRGRRRRGGTS